MRAEFNKIDTSSAKQGVLTINFKEVQLTDKVIFDQFLGESQHNNSEATFTYHYMWRKLGNVRWTILDHCLCILQDGVANPFFFQPYGVTEHTVKHVLEQMTDYLERRGKPLRLRGLTQPFVDLVSKVFPGRFSFEMNRDTFDYLYLGADLRELKGRQYTKKRNHINAFMREHPDFSYCAISHEVIPRCLSFIEEWFSTHESTYLLEKEKEAIFDMLASFEPLKLKGAVIEINGKVEALTLGEAVNEHVAVIHIEKANSEIRGLYPVINQEFCRREWKDKFYINREEDMGVASLRKSKESYYPVQLLEKFSTVEAEHLTCSQEDCLLKKCYG